MNVMNISDIQTLCVVGLLRSLLQITVNPPFCAAGYRETLPHLFIFNQNRKDKLWQQQH